MAALEEVEKAKTATSFIFKKNVFRLSLVKNLINAEYVINICKNKVAINKITYLRASPNTFKPSAITNLPIKQKTPIGAKAIIITTNCIKTVFNFSKDSLRLLVKWFVLFRASPKIILKKTIASI